MKVRYAFARELAMRVLGLRPATLAATCFLLLAGCGGVTLTHPLSDERSTAVDERLIGFWELQAESVGEKEPGPGEMWPRIAVGRRKGDARAMEAVALEFEDGFVSVKRLEVWPTQIGDARYLGLRDPEKEEEGWIVVRYRIGDGGRLSVRVLDAEACAQAVEAGEVKGEVKSPDRGHEVVALTVVIQSTTDEVRAWIAKEGDKLFTKKDAVLRRLVERTSSDEEGAAEPAEPDAPQPPGSPLPPGEPDER